MRHTVGAALAVALTAALPAAAAAPVGASPSWTVALVGASGHGEAAAAGVLGAPTGVTATCSLISDTVTVTWTAVGGAATYALYQAAAKAGPYTGPVAAGITATSYTTGALGGGAFWFEVTAVQGANWTSARSTPAGATITLGLVCTNLL